MDASWEERAEPVRKEIVGRGISLWEVVFVLVV